MPAAPRFTITVSLPGVSTELFMISSGRADVWQEQADGSRKQLRRIGPGEFFGELGVAGILSERTEQPVLRAADGLLADQNWRAYRFAFVMGLRSVTAVVLVNGKGLAAWRL